MKALERIFIREKHTKATLCAYTRHMGICYGRLQQSESVAKGSEPRTDAESVSMASSVVAASAVTQLR